jgi:hypothetical protein
MKSCPWVRPEDKKTAEPDFKGGGAHVTTCYLNGYTTFSRRGAESGTRTNLILMF